MGAALNAHIAAMAQEEREARRELETACEAREYVLEMEKVAPQFLCDHAVGKANRAVRAATARLAAAVEAYSAPTPKWMFDEAKEA